MRSYTQIGALALVGSVLGTAVYAADTFSEASYPPGWSAPKMSEIRLGGSSHGLGNPERNTAAIDGELLTSVVWRPANTDFWWLGPRLHLGGHVNIAGKTNYVYTGLTWTWDDLVLPDFFAEVSFGAAVHDGYTSTYAPPDRAKMGCTALFRESGSLGYRLSENWTVMVTIDHISNAGLCSQNRGITNVGGRLGYRF